MRQNLQKLYTRLLAICLAALLLLSQMPAVFAAETSGKCGDNLNWSFADGRLTITGTGAMTDYTQVDMPPWYAFREQILYLSLPNGLTSIGSFAFYDCYNLMAITVPDSVVSIGQQAFCRAKKVAILNLGSGLRSIGRSAFEHCENIQDVRLPQGLETIDNRAFYRCAGLQYVTIPASVKTMGSGVFSYCKKLVQVDMQAPLNVVPSWTFYGCDSLNSVILPEETTATEEKAFSGCDMLTTVYYSGSEENAQQLQEQIGADETNFKHYGTVTTEPVDTEISTSTTSTNNAGDLVVHKTTVNKTEDATVSTTTNTVVKNDEMTMDAEVTATVTGQEGWQQVVDAIEEAQKQLEFQESRDVITGKVDVNVYVTGATEVPKDVLDKVADSNVDMTVQSEDGSKFAVSGSNLQQNAVPEKLELSYAVAYLAAPDFKELNGISAYKLTFHNSSEIKAEVMVRFPTTYARKTASLYQVNGRKLEHLQNVMVDSEGYAHFYLASVNQKTQYRIGVDVKGIDQNSVLIPEDLHAEYGVTDMVFASDMYVITGRTSSWGVNMTQVTIMLMAVMVVCAVAVGVFMYIRNKKKLAAGYVPDISEEDLEEE